MKVHLDLSSKMFTDNRPIMKESFRSVTDLMETCRGRFGADILSLAQFFGQREKHRGEYYLIIERKFYFILFSRNYIFLYIIHKTNVNVILYIYILVIKNLRWMIDK